MWMWVNNPTIIAIVCGPHSCIAHTVHIAGDTDMVCDSGWSMPCPRQMQTPGRIVTFPVSVPSLLPPRGARPACGRQPPIGRHGRWGGGVVWLGVKSHTDVTSVWMLVPLLPAPGVW